MLRVSSNHFCPGKWRRTDRRLANSGRSGDDAEIARGPTDTGIDRPLKRRSVKLHATGPRAINGVRATATSTPAQVEGGGEKKINGKVAVRTTCDGRSLEELSLHVRSVFFFRTFMTFAGKAARCSKQSVKKNQLLPYSPLPPLSHHWRMQRNRSVFIQTRLQAPEFCLVFVLYLMPYKRCTTVRLTT